VVGWRPGAGFWSGFGELVEGGNGVRTGAAGQDQGIRALPGLDGHGRHWASTTLIVLMRVCVASAKRLATLEIAGSYQVPARQSSRTTDLAHLNP